MITENQVQLFFVDKFKETNASAPDKFASAIAKRVNPDVTPEILERAAEALIRSRKARSFPNFAECLEIINSPARLVAQSATRLSDADKADGDWPEDVAISLCRCHIGRQAVRNGWIGQLVDFVRREHRLPDDIEAAKLPFLHRKFRDAYQVTLSGGLAGLWRPLGEKIMRRNEEYERQIFDAEADVDLMGAK